MLCERRLCRTIWVLVKLKTGYDILLGEILIMWSSKETALSTMEAKYMKHVLAEFTRALEFQADIVNSICTAFEGNQAA